MKEKQINERKISIILAIVIMGMIAMMTIIAPALPSWIYKVDGNKTSRDLCPRCNRKACMYCFDGQDGHFKVNSSCLSRHHCLLSSQTILACFAIALWVHLGLIPLLVLLLANYASTTSPKSYVSPQRWKHREKFGIFN